LNFVSPYFGILWIKVMLGEKVGFQKNMPVNVKNCELEAKKMSPINHGTHGGQKGLFFPRNSGTFEPVV